jgi:polyhydroxyalkanoate synthesis regulator phasin
VVTAPKQDVAEQLAEAILKPLHDVGMVLAKQIDDLTAEVRELQQHVKALQDARDE